MSPAIPFAVLRRIALPVGLAFAVLTAGPVLSEPGASAAKVLELPKVKSNDGEFLPPDQAFRLYASPAGPDSVRLTWEIAEGYYLYRGRLKVASHSPDAQLGQLVLPTGETKTDEYFGKQEIYHNELVATLPLARRSTGVRSFPLDVTYQGCATAGLCYPPITKTFSIDLPPGAASGSAATAGTTLGSVSAQGPTAGASRGDSSGAFVSEQDRYAAALRSGGLAAVLGLFFVTGLALAFTPCVLPMVPIVSGIIVGQGRHVTARQGFVLSLAYVLGMAATYALAGVAVGAGGQQVQAAFQQPWIILLFAALFVVLALSMFGLFTVQMPGAIQTRIAALSNRQAAGTLGGVFVMGALSALIVTTCVAPALVGALIVIGQSGNMLRGGIALFVMGLGMGTPLLVVGASAGRLLPKAGPWMTMVKQLFGALMLVVAAWMLSRIVADRFMLALWAVPAISAAAVLWSGARGLRAGAIPARLAAVAAGVYAVVLLTGAALGGTDPLAPLPQFGASHRELTFRSIKSVADLDREVAAARAAGRPVMLDFYADWCVSCKEMAKYTFTDTKVQAALDRAVLLRADVTRNDAEDQALLKRFNIFGPPTIAFYGADGEERRNFRVVGYMKAPEFASLAQLAFTAASTTARAGSP
jgi:thioredoxin:protein disulfide reductase